MDLYWGYQVHFMFKILKRGHLFGSEKTVIPEIHTLFSLGFPYQHGDDIQAEASLNHIHSLKLASPKH